MNSKQQFNTDLRASAMRVLEGDKSDAVRWLTPYTDVEQLQEALQKTQQKIESLKYFDINVRPSYYVMVQLLKEKIRQVLEQY